LLGLLQDAGIRARMGLAARERVEQCFADAVVIGQTCEVYARATGGLR
jgi:hypothetical protein